MKLKIQTRKEVTHTVTLSEIDVVNAVIQHVENNYPKFKGQISAKDVDFIIRNDMFVHARCTLLEITEISTKP